MSEAQIRVMTPSDWQVYKSIRLQSLLDSPDSFGSTYAREVLLTDVEWRAREACVLDTNSGSVRVLEKTGFCFESVLRNHRMVRGTPRDFLLYFVTSQGQVP